MPPSTPGTHFLSGFVTLGYEAEASVREQRAVGADIKTA